MTDTPAAPERQLGITMSVDRLAQALEAAASVFLPCIHLEAIQDAGDLLAILSARADLSEARVKELEATLQWYADKVNDCNRHGSDGNAARDALAKDTGDRARAALEGE